MTKLLKKKQIEIHSARPVSQMTFFVAFMIHLGFLGALPVTAALAKRAPIKAHPVKAHPIQAHNDTLNDAWYTMQAGAAPWGYFHEVIIKKDGKYFYRYEMTKRENEKIYSENIGAVAEEDLTPVAFNLNKSGEGLMQSFSGTYEKTGASGIFTMTYKGASEKSFQRHVEKSTILEVFFPVWVHQHWAQLKSGYRGSLTILAEDPEVNEYRPKTIRMQFVKERPGLCKDLRVEMDNRPTSWCLTSSGSTVDMVVGQNEVQVKRLPDGAGAEQKAKAFMGQR